MEGQTLRDLLLRLSKSGARQSTLHLQAHQRIERPFFRKANLKGLPMISSKIRFMQLTTLLLIGLAAIPPAAACDGWCCPVGGGSCYQPSGEDCNGHDVLYCSLGACNINCLAMRIEIDVPEETCWLNEDGTWTGEIEVN